MPRELIVERIVAMRHQEEKVYGYDAYLVTPEMGSSEVELNPAWREKICQWSYNVIDHFDLPRELVAISLSLFDRYLATFANQCNGNVALLVSLTTLHIAIKMHAEKKIKISTLASLSRGQFSSTNIEEMEWKIFNALKWRLHPPTQFAFISHFMLLLPKDAHHSVRKDLFEHSIYMAELSVCDSFFVKFKASTVAFAAILNVVDDMSYTQLPKVSRDKFIQDLSAHVGLSRRTPSVLIAREKLHSMFQPTVIGECLDTRLQNPSQTHNDFGPHSSTVVAAAAAAAAAVGSRGGRYFTSHARAGNIDNKGRNRYSASPRRRFVVAASSPMVATRGRICASPIVAGVQ